MCGFCEIYMGVLGMNDEIKRRGLLQQGSKVCDSVHMQMRFPAGKPPWNGNDKAWNTHNQLFSLSI